MYRSHSIFLKARKTNSPRANILIHCKNKMAEPCVNNKLVVGALGQQFYRSTSVVRQTGALFVYRESISCRREDPRAIIELPHNSSLKCWIIRSKCYQRRATALNFLPDASTRFYLVYKNTYPSVLEPRLTSKNQIICLTRGNFAEVIIWL